MKLNFNKILASILDRSLLFFLISLSILFLLHNGFLNETKNIDYAGINAFEFLNSLFKIIICVSLVSIALKVSPKIYTYSFNFIENTILSYKKKAKESLKLRAGKLRDGRNFWDYRVSNTFPGLNERASTFTKPSEIHRKLKKLFKKPICFQSKKETLAPIWWDRGSQDFYITSVRIRSPGKKSVLLELNSKLLNVTKISYINGGYDWNKFVYVEAEPITPDQSYTSQHIEKYGPSVKEYGLIKLGPWRKKITLSELDDGRTYFIESPFTINGSTSYRSEAVTKYNLLIRPAFSSIVNQQSEKTQKFMNGILTGKFTFDELVEHILNLPKPSQY